MLTFFFPSTLKYWWQYFVLEVCFTLEVYLGRIGSVPQEICDFRERERERDSSALREQSQIVEREKEKKLVLERAGFLEPSWSLSPVSLA